MLVNGVCSSSCDSAYFNNNGICIPCSSTCIACSDQNTCNTCKSPLYLVNGKCVTSCLGCTTCALYQVYSSVMEKCIDCESNCQSCSISMCTKCIDGSESWLSQNSLCKLKNQNMFYIMVDMADNYWKLRKIHPNTFECKFH